MKKIICLLFIVLFTITLCSCAQDPSEVNLASENQIKKYCKQHYGPVKSVEEISKEDQSITYKIKDKKYKFEYEVTSYVAELWIDTTLGYYEKKKSNFDDMYILNFKNKYSSKINTIENTYNINLDTYSEISSDIVGKITGKNDDEIKEGSEKIIKLIEKYYKRNHFYNITIELYNDNTYIGTVSKDKGIYTAEEEVIDKLLINAAQYMDVSRKDLIFVRLDTTDIKSLPDYDSNEIVEILGEEKKKEAMVCYFKYNNEEYYITDVYINDDYHQMRPLGNYPINNE